MGKQVNFFMFPEDELPFVQFALAQGDVLLLADRSREYKPLILDALPAEDSDLVWRSHVLLWKARYPLCMHSGLMEAGPLVGQLIFHVDTMQSSVVEFSRSILRPDGCTLSRGRLWADMWRLEGDRLVHKGDEFVAWYDSLARWIRRHLRSLRLPSHSSEYLGPKAYDWYQAGGRLDCVGYIAQSSVRSIDNGQDTEGAAS